MELKELSTKTCELFKISDPKDLRQALIAKKRYKEEAAQMNLFDVGMPRERKERI